jgi:tetratricopeptide (TPR) repeat protein
MLDDTSAALRSFEHGLKYAHNKSLYSGGQYSDFLVYSQQHDRAIRVLVDRSAQTQHYADYYKLGRVYQTAGKPKQQWEAAFQRARAVLENAIAANPQDALAHAYLALTNTRLGIFKEALEANARAVQLAPHDITVLYCAARMFALQNDKKQAIAHIGKAIDQRYDLSSICDMDFYLLRSDPEFLQAVTR